VHPPSIPVWMPFAVSFTTPPPPHLSNETVDIEIYWHKIESIPFWSLFIKILLPSSYILLLHFSSPRYSCYSRGWKKDRKKESVKRRMEGHNSVRLLIKDKGY
jgi:hypothetical protein